MAKKINLNIQLFNSAEDQWFDQTQQVALLQKIKTALDNLTTATDSFASGISTLADEWHSQDAVKYGNPIVTDLKTFIKESREYVASITSWLSSHGQKINVINGNSVSFAKSDASASIVIKDFTDNAQHRGLANVSTATNTKTKLTEAASDISAALSSALSAASSNLDAFPGGIVSSSLLPTIRTENARVNMSFSSLTTNLTSFLEKLSGAISEATTNAATAASSAGKSE